MNKKIYKINLEKDRSVIGLLAEICWGFRVHDFEKKIGVKYEIAEALLERLLREEKAGIIETQLTDFEVEIIKNALVEVEKEIEEWEFQTRFGVDLKDVKEISIFKKTSKN